MLLLWLFVAFASSQIVEEDTCLATKKCECNKTFGFEIECPQPTLQYVYVDILEEEEDVYFRSNDLNHSEFKFMLDMNLRRHRSFCFTSCPLPQGKPLETYLKKIRIERIRSVHFISYGANRNIHITSDFLSGLSEIEKFDFRGLTGEISELSVDIFRDMTMLTWLRIGFPKIHLPAGIFAPLKNLEELDLNYNSLSILENGLLQNLTELRVLKFEQNSLRHLSKDVFLGLSSLRELDLQGNELESLEPDVFYHLTALAVINLNGNHFFEIPDGLFANNKALRVVHLEQHFSQLNSLPRDLLVNLTELETVAISNGAFGIPENIFSGSKRIREIYVQRFNMEVLSKNLLKDQEALEWLFLENSGISQIEDGSFLSLKRLKKFHLSGNQLTKIPK